MKAVKPLSVLAIASALALTALAKPAQVPLQASGVKGSWNEDKVDPNRWRLDVPLRNNTSNFVFDGVSGLLQQWANTRYRNGHMIVPGIIPAGTLLYHGTTSHTMPSNAEWLATDPEHAHLFCRELAPDTGCWLLTVAPVRPLKVLYFDGSSAAKMYGVMDTQDLLMYGDVVDKGERVYGEPQRIKWFCDWAEEKGYDLDGIVRMEPDFEIMLCDFNSPSISTVSFSHLHPGWKFNPNFPAPRKPLPDGETHAPIQFFAFRALEAGMWHNDFPGETRIKLDLSRLISFYDEESFPSLVEARRGKERWEHRVGNVTKEEKAVLLDKVDELFVTEAEGSGVDWTSMHRVIIHRYSERLEILQYLLANTTQHDTAQLNVTQDMVDIHDYVRGMITQYMLFSATPQADAGNGPPYAWASPIFEKCATAYTSSLSSPSSPLAPKLTPSEKLLSKSVDGVLHEICRVLVGIWAEGEELGLGESPASLRLANMILDTASLLKVAANWLEEIASLVEWLDWSVWVKCKPGCGEEVRC
ncbi:hypothetical protein BKA70DRAFT_1222196 [Coprinopsis sp. MPI-PUGE-AT-0042]|nr:hypothetical protein BKA70DRAFT_1222196 [Coprinopsis sp. MPI-PUGE-AT-0042]